jgi:hypothetical protein
MPKGVFVVFTNSTDAADDAEFNRWYDEVHIPQISGLPGFLAARRFKASDFQALPDVVPDHGYLTIYELEAESLAEPMEALAKLRESGEMIMSHTMRQADPETARFVYEELETGS